MATTQLHWKSHPRVTCFYAAKAWLHKRTVAYGPLVEAIAGPAVELERTLLADQFDVDKFLDHLIPLSQRQGNYADLAQEALFRLLHGDRARLLAPKYQACLERLAQPYYGILERLSEKHPVNQDWLPNLWKMQGPALLHALARWTEPEALSPQGDVVLVHPITDGYGEVYPLHNLIVQEAVSAETKGRLPAIVRLAWLVGCLACHTPRYSDGFATRPRALQVGMLALLPATLKAAEDLKLAKCDAPTLSQAITQWLPRNLIRPMTQLWGWWEAYQQVRLPWKDAVIALGQIVD
jgi:hypothetical protein